MSTHATSKVFYLPDNVTIKPLYDKCPGCGCNLNQMPEEFVDLMRATRGVQAVRKSKIILVLRKSWIGRLLTQKGNPL